VTLFISHKWALKFVQTINPRPAVVNFFVILRLAAISKLILRLNFYRTALSAFHLHDRPRLLYTNHIYYAWVGKNEKQTAIVFIENR